MKGDNMEESEHLGGNPGEAEQLGQAPDPREAEIAALKQNLNRTLGAYRESLIKLNPELPAELVGGDTLQDINESLGRARALVSKVRQSLEAEKAAGRVPAGAPPRSEADYSNLSSREKIQLGIGGK
jgi:hypothetical protein